MDKSPDTLRVALLGDTHFIDEFYRGPESSELNTSSLYEASDNFDELSERLAAISPKLEAIFHVGDIIHQYPSSSLRFYDENRTSFDIAAEKLAAAPASTYACLGNHDYDLDRFTRDTTHALFLSKLGLPLYRSVDLAGFKFVLLNCFSGRRSDPASADFDSFIGSFGEAQLAWLDAQLSEGLPTFVLTHYPAEDWDAEECGELNIFSVLSRHIGVVELIVVGHRHRWAYDKYIERELPEESRLIGDNGVPAPGKLAIPQLVLGGVRYDPNAAAILELNPSSKSWRILNQPAFRYGERWAGDWDIS